MRTKLSPRRNRGSGRLLLAVLLLGLRGLEAAEVSLRPRPENLVWMRDAPSIAEFTLPGEPAVDGVLIRPKGEGQFPAVILNHGGGMVPSWCEFEFGGIDLARAGFVVVAHRSTHSGDLELAQGQTLAASAENFRRLDRVLCWLDQLDFVDSRRLAMAGHSMGGLLTVGYLANGIHRDRFLAAASVSAGIVTENIMTARVRSFSSRAVWPTPTDGARIRCPLLLIHGKADPTLTDASSRELALILQAQGREAALVLLEGEGHHVYRTRRAEVFEPMIEFFRRHLMSAR